MKHKPNLFHPNYKREPFWWEASCPDDEYSESLPSSTDVVVVGSGYTGLSAALELIRAGLNVTVVEALAFGEGASSRSGGGVSAGVNIGKGISGGPGQSKKFARDRTLLKSLMVESLSAFELVEKLVKEENIQCHFERRGRFIGAINKQHYEKMKTKADYLNEVIKVGARLIPQDEQYKEIGSSFYYGGMVIEKAAKLHPSLFHRGLLNACYKAGVKLCSRTKVTRIKRSRGKFEIITESGKSNAEHVIIATNGYTGDLSPILRKHIVPISSQIIVTEDLPKDLAAELVPNGRTISESSRITSYYRLLPGDRRVMYGGRVRFNSIHPDISAQLLHNMMIKRWPQIKDARITHSWSGFVAMTADSLPHIGIQNGIHFCTGCNGSGIAMMTYLGKKTAENIIDGSNCKSAYLNIDFPKVPVPFYRGNPWFLPIIGNYYRYLDRQDRKKDE